MVRFTILVYPIDQKLLIIQGDAVSLLEKKDYPDIEQVVLEILRRNGSVYESICWAGAVQEKEEQTSSADQIVAVALRHIVVMDKYLDGLRSMRLYRQANTLPTTSGAQQITFRLENVASYTMELDVGDRRGFSTFTLRGVPVFLVEAFNFLRLNGLDASGIFRKEGNIGRLRTFSMHTFFGSKKLPDGCTTHDVCSLIKRFFRELKTPLFAHLQAKLLEVATVYSGAPRVDKLLDAVRLLPAEHLATLAFLMRQLKYFGDRHEGHQMTVENIARVFAPSLFRDDPPPAPNKRKRGSQEDLISNVRNENELRISIIIDLIDSAHKIGVPRDYYIASRRPSDVSQKLFKGKFMGGAGTRSISAKPTSRNTPSTAPVKQKADFRKERKLEKQPSIKYAERHKNKTPRERRSSSTVRDFFSNISNKVLRRGLSPGASGRRRCSAGDVTDDEILRENMIRTEAVAPKFCVHNHADACDSAEHTPRLTFENEEAVPGSSRSGTLGRLESPLSVGSTPQKIIEKRPQTISLEANIRVPSGRNDDTETATTSRHRSRRESPRKCTTANSRRAVEKCKIIREIKEANMMPASPAFEPPEMSIKPIGEAFMIRRDSGEKSAVSKIIKRNSSKKKLLQSVKIADSAHSFLEGYSAEKITDRNRRRHTAPVKASTLLKRNQPNTVGTGLKTPQSRARERRSTTLSLRPNGMDDSPITFAEKKKRRSESLGADSSDKISASDDENDTVKAHALNAEALLEQKCTESRQRRAKRQKRREEMNGSTQRVQAQDTMESKQMISLLDDVTNEINRLERDRKVTNGVLGDDKSALLSFSDVIGKDRDLETISIKEDVPPPLQSISPAGTTQPSSVAIPSVSRNTSTKFSSAADADLVKKPHQSPPDSTSFHSATLVFKSPPSIAVTAVCSKTVHVETPNRVTKQRSADVIYNNTDGRESGTKERGHSAVFGEDFSKSDAIKRQILSARSDEDIVTGPAYIPRALRPSVLSISTNNRGMVQQRVNLFAQLSTQGTIEEQDSGSPRQWQDGEYASSSLQKPRAPPPSHGVRTRTGGNISAPSREKVTKQAKKFEALAASVGMEAFRSFRPTTRNKLSRIQKQNTPRAPRRLSGERRETRNSQTRLEKSLGKLAESLSSGRLSGRSPGPSSSGSRMSLADADSDFKGRRRSVGRSPARAPRQGRLKYVNPSIILRSTNLQIIPEATVDI